MVALVALFAVSLVTIGYVLLRSRVMFLIGLRNIPRRPAQTLLIIIGLMLSTLIISAALTTGDTVDYSITNRTYVLLGHVDEVIQEKSDSEGFPAGATSVMPQKTAEQLRKAIENAGANVDGFLPVMTEPVPVLNSRTRQREPAVNFVGLDAESMSGFPDVVSKKTGQLLDIAALADDEAFMNEVAADELDAAPGDDVEVFVAGQSHVFKVVDVVEDRLLTGAGDFRDTKGLVTRLDTLQELVKREGEVDYVAVSNTGGGREGLDLTELVQPQLEGVLKDERLDGQTKDASVPVLEAENTKRILVNEAEDAGNFMATFFLLLGLFSIAAGVLLILMIFVMLATERKSEMGMARAVGTKRGHLVQMFMSEGMAYNILSALVGAALGIVVAFAIAQTMARIFPVFGLNIATHVTPRSLIAAYTLGVVLTYLSVTFASWRVSKLNIVRAIRDLPEPRSGGMGWRWLAAGVLGIAAGILLVLVGTDSDAAFPFALGFSLVIAGAAIVLRLLRLPDRLVFTTMGSLLLVLWGLTAGNRLESLFGTLDGDIEMFFLSGVAMVTASTFVLVYNADLILSVVSRMGAILGGALPAIKTAVAYPLANKFRTGMTLAMISLVVFALTMMSSMNLNFDKLFLSDFARGGWDVVVDENANNPIPDLGDALRENGSGVQANFKAVGRVTLARRSMLRQSQEGENKEFDEYPVKGVTAGLIDGGSIPLKARAGGFANDAEVWQAFKTRSDVAVVDGFTVESDGGFREHDFAITGIPADAEEFDPITLEMRRGAKGEVREVQVIGVIDFGASENFFGVFIPQETFDDVFSAPLVATHYVALKDTHQSTTAAKDIESTLFDSGVQAESLKDRAEDQRALFRSFFLLMQGFMGLGLFVGIAALGVIAFRTVVERRQHIGMLRAIGYRRSTIALTFILESSFVTLLGIGSGVGLALWLSYFLVTSDDFPSELGGYYIPWLQIGVISGFTYGASLLMTIIPSRQAASVPVAEALRYE